MATWKSKRATVAAALVAPLIIALLESGDIPEKQPGDKAVSLKGKTASERVMAKNFERENAAVGEEITTLRSQTAKVRKLDGNRLTAEVSAKPAHWFDPEDSVWRDIDLTVHEISALAKLNPLKKIDKYVQAGNYRAGWSDEKPHDYTFLRENAELTFAAQFDTSATLRIATTPQVDGVKQTITVYDAEAAAVPLVWELASNADEVTVEDGRVVFRLDGAEMFAIAAPVVWDADGKPIAAAYSLDGNELTLTVDYPAEPKFPVSIDPTTQVASVSGGIGRAYNGDASTFLTARNSVDGDAVDTYVQSGINQSGHQVNRGFYMFNTAFLAADDIVDSASVNTIDAEDEYEDVPLVVHLVNGTFSDSTLAVGWFNDFTGWASSGDYSLTDLGDSIPSESYAKNDSIHIGLNAAGIADIDKAGYTKYALISTSDALQDEPAGEGFMRFSNTPVLRITYHTAVPVVVPALTIAAVADASISLAIAANGNGSAATYSIKITHPGGHQNYWSGADTTATETFKSLAGWGAMPEVINARLATNGEYWLDVRAIGELADTSAVVRIGARAWDKRQNLTINSILESFNTAPSVGADYNTERAEATDDSLNTTDNDPLFGQNTGYFIGRAHVRFLIPSMTTNTADTLYAAVLSDHSAADFNIWVYRGDWNTSATTDDLQKKAHYSFDGWLTGTNAYVGTAYNNTFGTSGLGATMSIPLPGGVTAINAARGDTLGITLISEEDRTASAPVGEEYITLDSTPASNISIHAGWDSTEVAAAAFTMNPIDPDTIECAWTTGLGSNVGFLIVDASTGAALTDTLDFDDTMEDVAGLTTNTLYSWKLKTIGGVNDGTLTAAASAYTWPETPTVPTVSNPANDSLKVVIALGGNPAATKFLPFAVTSTPETLVFNRYRRILQAITPFFVNSDSLNATIAANDSVWGTYANFGSASGLTVPSEAGKTYTVKVLAKSGP